MIFLALFLGIIMLVLLFAFGRTRAYLSRHKSATIVVVLVYLAIVILQPYAFGIRGRLAERSFGRHLRLGMSRDEVIHWANTVGWDNSYLIDTAWQMHEPYSTLNHGRLDITFIDWSSFCVVGGKDYQFYFSPDWKVTKWHIEPWNNGC